MLVNKAFRAQRCGRLFIAQIGPLLVMVVAAIMMFINAIAMLAVVLGAAPETNRVIGSAQTAIAFQ